MTYTENFELNQWQKSDRLMMSDFNADNQKLDAALATKAELVTGSYTGTGTYGEDNKTTLTLPFVPKLVLIWSAPCGMNQNTTSTSGWSDSCFWTTGIEYQYISCSDYVTKFALNGTTLSFWHQGTRANAQLNQNGRTYHYLALG